mgnify:CR=1 FL=1
MGMAFALLPFFQFFRGTPHQLAAIKELEQSVPKGLLEEDTDWFQAWKESGYDQQIYMPYFKQLDKKGLTAKTFVYEIKDAKDQTHEQRSLLFDLSLIHI